jgi:pyruvate dehydrogenase kinase 2/3/4
LPSFIYYIVLELLKNSMRATIEHYKRTHDNKLPSDENDLPPVRILISGSKDSDDVSIRISDLGGGISRHQMPKIFSYLFTTADLTPFSTDSDKDWDRESPMAGLGVGLPLSRLYAKYFGGDLQLASVEGYGTDAYVYLPQRGTHAPNMDTGHLSTDQQGTGMHAHFQVPV